MSSRHDIYCLADELYEMQRQASLELYVKKKQVVAAEQRKVIWHVIAIAAMKYSLLSVSSLMENAFYVQTVVNPKGNSAGFILYSGARIQ
jgi:arginyl-tRNA synthetase